MQNRFIVRPTLLTGVAVASRRSPPWNHRTIVSWIFFVSTRCDECAPFFVNVYLDCICSGEGTDAPHRSGGPVDRRERQSPARHLVLQAVLILLHVGAHKP